LARRRNLRNKKPKGKRRTASLERGPSIVNIFPNRALVDVLTLLLLHADQEYYQRNIAEQTGRSVIEIQRALKRIERAGLIEKVRRGNRVYYSARRDHPAFDDLRSLLVKTTGLADVIREALLRTQARIRLAFVFGSIALGKESASSDIDLLIVGNLRTQEAVGTLAPLEKVLGREINPIVYTPEEFKQKLSDRDHFIRSVLRQPKIWIVGGEDELERLAG